MRPEPVEARAYLAGLAVRFVVCVLMPLGVVAWFVLQAGWVVGEAARPVTLLVVLALVVGPPYVVVVWLRRRWLLAQRDRDAA